MGRSETHHVSATEVTGFASLNPSYGIAIRALTALLLSHSCAHPDLIASTLRE